MADEFSVLVPVRPPMVEVVLTQEMQQLPPAVATPALTPEQVHAQEAVFTQEAEHAQDQPGAGLLGIWMGTMLLHDIGMQSSSEPEDEEGPERKPEENNETE